MTDAALIDRYRDSFLRHLPSGKGISRALASSIAQLAAVLAIEPARVHERALDLLREAVPPKAVELLSEWERVFDLPDACFPATTVEDRQSAIAARLAGAAGHGFVDYQTLAEVLGYVGLEFSHYPPFVVDSSVDDYLYDDTWAHAVRVRYVPGYVDELLLCALRRHHRAHTVFHFETIEPLLIGGEPLLIGGEPLEIHHA